jgi:tripartite-type tricarboxylate transporter receptor subunit TctC
VLLATGSLLAINVSLYKNIGYDPEKDFEPISLVGTQTNVLYANPSVPATSLAELIAYAKANPGKLSFGSGGNGTPAHRRRAAQASSQDRYHARAVPGHRAGVAGGYRWPRADGI